MFRRGYDNTAPFGGIEWSAEAEKHPGMIDNSRSEQYPVLAPYIDGDGVFIVNTFFVYQFDDIPGVSLPPWQQNESSDETAWFYKTYTYLGTSVEDDISAIKQFNLEQNYPNPFNPNTVIKYQIPAAGYVSLKIYDVLGSEVATLVDEYKNAGSYEVEFNTQQSTLNKQLASGIYFYQLKAGNPSTSSGQSFIETRKMILLK
ncbi:MAG: T9SS type A sorting domain-containing protein, partial [Ignavibacteriaceae bacterium]